MKKSAIIIAGMLLLGACYYSNNETHFVQVEPGPEPVLNLAVNLDTLDSIRIVDSLMVEYELTVEGGELYQVDFFLDNFYIFRSDSVTNQFYINPTYLTEEGDYDLKTQVFYSTNSGTIADQFDAEANMEEKTWVVTINREQ